jgi:hypothetical protein
MGFRPEYELYYLPDDPMCVNNLSDSDKARIEAMNALLVSKLKEQGDPRMEGKGDIFDSYPFYQPKFQDFYERYLRGEVEPSDNKTFLMSDYESEAIAY